MDPVDLPAPSESAFADLGDHRIEYMRYPAAVGDRPPVVFLHEGLGSVAMWRDFPALTAAATGAEVIVYSRRGYGKSSRLDDSNDLTYMHREGMQTLPRLLDYWGVSSPVLAGHSDGGSMALIHAAQPDADVAGVCVMAPHYFVEQICVDSISDVKKTFLTTDLKFRLGKYHANPEHTFWGWNDIWLHPDFPTWSIEALVPDIRCPILAIQGEDDEFGTMQQIDGLAELASGPVERLKLEDCGHSPHRDKPIETLQALAEFVERTAS